MKTTLVRNVFVGLFFVNLLRSSSCGICEPCVCTQSDNARTIYCRGDGELANYTELFDLLAVEDTRSLRNLTISNYEVTSLRLDAFRGLTHLTTLDLSDNSISIVGSGIFKDLKSLETLDLSNNRLEVLSGTVFRNIETTLLRLNLSNNKIGDFSDTTGGQLLKLLSLDLSSNELKTIDYEFVRSLKNLRFLDVSHNRVKSLASGVLLGLKFLSDFRISDNSLKFLSREDFPESITRLNVAGNSIEKLPWNFSQIRDLDVAENEMRTLEIGDAWSRELRHLNASGNSLTTFPNIIFASLKMLDLSSNNFTNVPATLSTKNLPMLEKLIIDSNPIEDLRFPEELKLRRISASRLRRLTTIMRGAFAKLKAIDDAGIDIVVSENPGLNSIQAGALDDVSICNLDLSRNAFVRVSPEAIKSGDKFVAAIDLQGNPFSCDCQSQWMLNDLVPHLYNVQPELLEDLRCKTPPELEGKRMVHWYKWKRRVFCDPSSQEFAKLMLNEEPVIAGSQAIIRLKPGGGMLAIVAGATGTLCVLIVVGIVVARKLELRKRRVNRKF